MRIWDMMRHVDMLRHVQSDSGRSSGNLLCLKRASSEMEKKKKIMWYIIYTFLTWLASLPVFPCVLSLQVSEPHPIQTCESNNTLRKRWIINFIEKMIENLLKAKLHHAIFRIMKRFGKILTSVSLQLNPFLIFYGFSPSQCFPGKDVGNIIHCLFMNQIFVTAYNYWLSTVNGMIPTFFSCSSLSSLFSFILSCNLQKRNKSSSNSIIQICSKWL